MICASDLSQLFDFEERRFAEERVVFFEDFGAVPDLVEPDWGGGAAWDRGGLGAVCS